VWNVSARWRGFPFAVLDQQFRLNVEASYQRLGALQSALVTRGSLQVALPGGFDLAIAVERNPFFRDEEGRAGIMSAVRLTAGARVFTPKSLGPEGIVYEDMNQNGRRDDGEPGVPGVVVRRGESRATTNARGAYRLPSNARGRSTIEQASLRAGLIADPSIASDTVERLDLAVVPTGTVTVQLELVPDDNGRVPDVDLEPAIVVLRDAHGFEWVARRTSKTAAVFDGIPVGAYEMRFDFSRLREPLRAPDTIRVIVAPHSEQTVKAPLRGRVIRMFDQGRVDDRRNDVPPRDRQR
jgi:hypothetical protein